MNINMRIIFFLLFLSLFIICGFFIGEYFSNKNIKMVENSHQHLHETLNLTPDQLNKLIPIEEKFSEQKALYEGQIHHANIALGDIMKREKAYTPAVKEAVEKVHVAMGLLQEATLIHFFDMRELLDENQARILDNYVAEAMHGL